MFEGKLTIDVSPSLEKVLYRLCDMMKQLSVAPNTETGEPVNPIESTVVDPTATAPTAAPDAPDAPDAPQIDNAEPSVPVAPAPVYTRNQISKAGAELIAADPAKMSALQELLAQFNVIAIPELKEYQFGAFAAELRELGANI